MPSSQSVRLDMAAEGILEPLMHLFFVLTRHIANHVLTKETVRLQGLLHFSESFFARRQRKVPASLPIRPSQETAKEAK